MVNEARLDFQQADPVTSFDPLTPSTQFTRAGAVPFTSGESRFVHVFSRVTQLSDTLTWTRGAHYLRMGGSVARSSSGGDGTEFGSAFVLTVAGNLTLVGSVANVIVAEQAREVHELGFGEYLRVGVPSTLLVLAVSVPVLLLLA